MAFVDGDGFDTYNGTGTTSNSAPSLRLKWAVTVGGGTPSTVTLIAGRFAGQAVRFTDGSVGSSMLRTLDSNCGPDFAFHFALRVTELPTGDQLIAALQFSGTTQLGVYLTTLNGIKIKNGSGTTLITSANNVWTQSVWCSIELRGTIANSADIEFQIDGANNASATGVDTLIAGTAAINNIYFGGWDSVGSGNVDIDVDDYALGDTAVFFGPTQAEILKPNADTATKQWTPSTGIINYQMVDEAICNGDTDYNTADTVGLKDLYDLPTLSIIPAAIHAVQLVAYARTTDSQARSISLNVDVSGLSNGSNQSLTSTYNQKRRVMALNPITGLAWQYVDISAMQIGQELTV